MPKGKLESSELARQLLFELQALLNIAEKIGVDTEKCKEYLKTASISSRIGTEDGIIDMTSSLNDARAVLEKSIAEFFSKDLNELNKEIEKKKANISQTHPIILAYNVAVNALKRKEYETVFKNIGICMNEISKISIPEKKVAYGKYYAKELTHCDTCDGKIKPGFLVIKCMCGKTHHETCAMREARCTCGIKFGIHKSS